MNRTLLRIAALLAFGLGAMSVVAGGQVLLGRTPGYTVISWLPAYNFGLGLLTALVTAPLIWADRPWALPAALGTLGVHSLALLLLLTAYRAVVAPDSLGATTFRVVVWLIILALMFFQSRRGRAAGRNQPNLS